MRDKAKGEREKRKGGWVKVILHPSAFILGCALAAGAALAQPYPTKPVRFIVGPGPGSGTDVVARAIALKLTERLGQSVIVENRAGAGGTIAGATVAKAPPDGYTILFVSGSLVVHPAIYRKLPYDVVRDLAPITLIGVVPQVLVVHPSLPVRTVREFIALAKARPGQINYGSGGVGSTGHLAGELLQADGVEPATGTPGQFADMIRTELVRVAKIVKGAGMLSE